MALIIGAAIAVTWGGWRRLRDGWRPYQLGVLLALLAVVVHGMVDVPYFKNDLSFEFWTLLGIAWAGIVWANRAPEPSPVEPGASRHQAPTGTPS